MTRPNPVPTENDRADAAMTEDDQGSFEKSKAVLKEVSGFPCSCFCVVFVGLCLFL
jgi:hypothetical protein